MTAPGTRRSAGRVRIVVTGIGVAAPTGIGAKEHWAAVLEGHSAIDLVTSFDVGDYPSRLAGEVGELDVAARVPRSLRVQTDATTHLAMAAGEEALTDAGIDPAALPDYEMGLVVANSSGGIAFAQRELQRLWSQGPTYVGAYMSVAWFYAATAGQLSIRHGLRGPCVVVAGEEVGSLDALGHACRQVRRGTPVMFAGGTDSSACPVGLSFQVAMRSLSTSDDPRRAYLPFDADASGWVPGHGGAMLVLEDRERALARGAHLHGEVVGHASTFDPPPGTGGEPGLRRAAELALDDAGMAPDEVDVVFPDAFGTLDADRAEAAAITGLFGPHGVPVTAPKTMTGRLTAGGGAVDVATALLAMRDGVVPPTANVTRLAPGCDLDLVTAPRSQPVTTALVLARGSGGFNTAVLVRKP